MAIKNGIKQKLSLIFFLFFLIFTGTVGVLLNNVQSMVQTTEHIVTTNNKIDKLAEALLSSLFEMEANHKKLIILKKNRYSEYFGQAKNDFETALTDVVSLSTRDGSGNIWHDLEFSYYRHREGLWSSGDVPEIGLEWISDRVVSIWQNNINLAKNKNQQEIEKVCGAPVLYLKLGLNGYQTGLYPFGKTISILLKTKTSKRLKPRCMNSTAKALSVHEMDSTDFAFPLQWGYSVYGIFPDLFSLPSKSSPSAYVESHKANHINLSLSGVEMNLTSSQPPIMK